MANLSILNETSLPNKTQYLRKDAPLICYGSGEKTEQKDYQICPICGNWADIHNHKIAAHKGK